MELQFQKTVLPGLQLVKREIRNLEETQELKIPDTMPDIGHTLGAWGQVLLRGKEWHNGSAHVSGGVQAWVLYVPEDGVGIQCMQTWIPFHAKWDLPDTDVDGFINTQSHLRSMDVRNTSSRKMMLRANVGVMGEMWILSESDLYEPEGVPEDVHLLRRKYDVSLPREIGEKTFTIEEELAAPAGIEKILHYSLCPEVQEQKVVSDKIVFRGTAHLHILYQGQEEQPDSWDTEVPFSQYGELDREYSADATVQITPSVTGVEVELDREGKLHLKAGIAGQYMIYDPVKFETVEDAYSPLRTVQPHMSRMVLPAMLDIQKQILTTEQMIPRCGGMVDTVFLQDHPYRVLDAGGMTMTIPGQFQVLCRDENGVLQYTSARWEGKWQLPEDDGSVVLATATACRKPQTAFDGNGMVLCADSHVEAVTFSAEGFPMVTGLELGELQPADPARPSLILRRAGKDNLWELAKKSGSTPERIQSINQLEDEPDPGQMLLIPIL